MEDQHFEYVLELPNSDIQERSDSLVGFKNYYQRVFRNLNLIIHKEQIKEWSKKHFKKELPVCKVLATRHPLVIFEGDVGTGKTVTAEGIANQIIKDSDKKEGYLLKLSTRVRGRGLHGEMSKLLQEGFKKLEEYAGKKRLAFLLIDEADTFASKRSTEQMHHEEKAAVNTLIQKLDDIRSKNGRAVVFLCTNRPEILDSAIVRRASLRIPFLRPDEKERLQLFSQALEGMKLSKEELQKLAVITGEKSNNGLGFTYSDIQLRVFPESVAQVFPDKPLSFSVLEEVIKKLEPSPKI